MSRCKGRTDKAIIEREFPPHVDLLTPPNGFGNQLNEIYDWLTAHGIKYRHGKGWREESPDRQSLWFVRWRFKDAESAKEFAAEFSEFLSSPITETTRSSERQPKRLRPPRPT